MKHVKAPIRINIYYEFGNDNIALWDKVQRGAPIAIVPEQLEASDQLGIAREIAAALNAHNALVGACKAALSFINEDADAYPPPYGYTMGEMKAALRAALALVEADQ